MAAALKMLWRAGNPESTQYIRAVGWTGYPTHAIVGHRSDTCCLRLDQAQSFIVDEKEGFVFAVIETGACGLGHPAYPPKSF